MFVIGVDFGTDSVRSIIVDTANGAEVSSSIFHYPRWRDGLYCDAASNQYRQHPLDHLEGLEYTVKACIDKAGADTASKIRAISCCTTGSSPIAVNSAGIPLAMLPAFHSNPNAMYILWKDHTSTSEALEINAHSEKFEKNYLQFSGGKYSSEWYWAKLLKILRSDEKVRAMICGWVEHCDLIPFMLSGGTELEKLQRSICAMGHKALYTHQYGFPPDEFFSSLDPLLKGFSDKLQSSAMCSADQALGTLSPEWAMRLGLSTDVRVGAGALDAHVGAVGGQIEAGHLVKVMGTSTCDMLVSPLHEIEGKLIKGICGQVKDSIIPGLIGMEAGQSAFGDSYAWFKSILMWPLRQLLPKSTLIDEGLASKLLEEAADNIISELSIQAELIDVDEASELGLDWLNGRRLDANQLLKGALSNLSLATDAPRMFRAIAEVRSAFVILLHNSISKSLILYKIS